MKTKATKIKAQSEPVIKSKIDIHEYYQSYSYLSIKEWEKLSHTVRPIGWLHSLDVFSKLYFKLRSYSLIVCSFEVFKKHFFDVNAISERIIWFGKSNALTLLISELMEEFFIPTTVSLYKAVSEHFISSRGNEYSIEKLRKNHNKGVRSPESQGNIERIIESLSN